MHMNVKEILQIVVHTYTYVYRIRLCFQNFRVTHTRLIIIAHKLIMWPQNKVLIIFCCVLLYFCTCCLLYDITKSHRDGRELGLMVMGKKSPSLLGGHGCVQEGKKVVST